MARVLMLSMFMNEVQIGGNGSDLKSRVNHLLEKGKKSEHDVDFIWVIGKVKSRKDATAAMLAEYAVESGLRGKVALCTATSDMRENTRDLPERLIRLSDHVRAGLEYLKPEHDFMMMHESDLVSDADIVDKFVTFSEQRNGAMVGGWPMVTRSMYHEDLFYDTWAYRKNGKMFTPTPPYCDGFNGEQIEVDSLGSAWLAPASFFQETLVAWPFSRAVMDICDGVKAQGGKIFADPSIKVKQPVSRLRESWSAEQIATS